MIPDPPDVNLIERALGVISGSVLALVFIIPKTKMEAVQRALVSLVAGAIFTTPLREYLDWLETTENIIAAGCLASFSSWWAMSAIHSGIRYFANGKNGKH